MKLPLLFTSVLLGTSLFTNTGPRGTEIGLTYHNVTTAKRAAAPILPVGTVYVVIDKSDYELNVYDDKGWYATYPVVFGNGSLADTRSESEHERAVLRCLGPVAGQVDRLAEFDPPPRRQRHRAEQTECRERGRDRHVRRARELRQEPATRRASDRSPSDPTTATGMIGDPVRSAISMKPPRPKRCNL